MADSKFLVPGIILASLGFIVGIWAIGSAPSLDATEACQYDDDTGEWDSWNNDNCEELMAEDETKMAVFSVFCCCIFPIGAALAAVGVISSGTSAPKVIYAQAPMVATPGLVQAHDPAYMMPPQPTYAATPMVSPVPQPSQAAVEAELRARRMANVEALRAEGRLMEAAHEAEMAGDYNLATQLRQQAEDLLRQEHTPHNQQEDMYLAFLTTALADGFLSVQEETLLETQRNNLGITWETHTRLLGEMGHSHDQLKQYQQAKMFEDSGRFLESAVLYEQLGNLDKAQMLRMKAKMLEGGGGGGATHTTYHISDSVLQQGGLNDPPI